MGIVIPGGMVGGWWTASGNTPASGTIISTDKKIVLKDKCSERDIHEKNKCHFAIDCHFCQHSRNCAFPDNLFSMSKGNAVRGNDTPGAGHAFHCHGIFRNLIDEQEIPHSSFLHPVGCFGRFDDRCISKRLQGG